MTAPTQALTCTGCHETIDPNGMHRVGIGRVTGRPRISCDRCGDHDDDLAVSGHGEAVAAVAALVAHVQCDGRPNCTDCDAPILFKPAERTVCERCRLDALAEESAKRWASLR